MKICAALIAVSAACLSTVPASAVERLYVTNEISGDLSVIDVSSRQLIATVPIGKRPRGIQAAPDGRTLYIALSGSAIAAPERDEATLPPPDRSADGIAVFDIASGRVTRVLRGISDPEQLAVSRDGAKIYVASEDAGLAIVLDTRTGARLATLEVGGEPEGVALSPDGAFLYMTSEAAHRVAVIDTRTDHVLQHFKVGLRPRAVAFYPGGAFAVVSGENDASVTIVDVPTHQPTRRVHLIDPQARPMGVVVAPDGRTVFVATGRGKKVVALDAHTFQVRAQAEAGMRPWGIALSKDGAYVFTANGPSNDVTILDSRTLRIIGRVRAGDRPWGLAVVSTQ